MQILPISETLETRQAEREQNGSQAAALFMDFLSRQLGQPSGTSTSWVPEGRGDALAQQDILSGTTPAPSAAADTQDDRFVSAEDFSAMRQELQELGYDPARLDELEARLESGLSYRALARELTESAQGAVPAKTVDSQTRTQLLSLLAKAGVAGAEAERLVDGVARGQGRELLRVLQQKLASLPADQPLTVNAGELKALGQALSLGARGRAALKGYLGQTGENGRMTMTPAGLRGVLTVLGNEAGGGPELAKRVTAMQELLAQVASRADGAADGMARADRLAQGTQDKWLDAKKDEKTFNSARAGAAAPGEARDKAAGLRPTAGGDKAKDGGLKDAGDQALAGRKAAADMPGLRLVGQSAGQNAGQAGRAQGSAPGGQARAAGLFEQVQRGVLQNLGDGQQKLTLQLKPEELGSLTLMLHMDGDELRATIKADNPEAARALAEQLGQLRTALERQGIKVAELGVEYGKPESQGGQPAWAEAQGHNSRQELQERARAQRLSLLRSQAVQNQEAPAAPPVAAGGETLNLIA